MTGKLISICPELCFPLAGFMMQNIPESSKTVLHCYWRTMVRKIVLTYKTILKGDIK